MNIHSDAYPEPIGRLQNENKYLKEEIEELKKKNTTLNNKLTDVEVQNKSLLLQVKNLKR